MNNSFLPRRLAFSVFFLVLITTTSSQSAPPVDASQLTETVEHAMEAVKVYKHQSFYDSIAIGAGMAAGMALFGLIASFALRPISRYILSTIHEVTHDFAKTKEKS